MLAEVPDAGSRTARPGPCRLGRAGLFSRPRCFPDQGLARLHRRGAGLRRGGRRGQGRHVDGRVLHRPGDAPVRAAHPGQPATRLEHRIPGLQPRRRSAPSGRAGGTRAVCVPHARLLPRGGARPAARPVRRGRARPRLAAGAHPPGRPATRRGRHLRPHVERLPTQHPQGDEVWRHDRTGD